MSQPQQIIFNTPTNDMAVVDNAASPSFPSLSAGAHLGYDTKTGAVAQASNPIADTGSTTLDTVNDTVYSDPAIITVVGNPVAAIQPTFKTVSTILNDSRQGLRLLWKNPA